MCERKLSQQITDPENIELKQSITELKCMREVFGWELVKVEPSEAFLYWFTEYLPEFILFVVIFNIAFIAVIFQLRCDNLGWKRLTLLLAGTGPLICLVLVFNRYWRLSRDDDLFQFISAFIASYFISLLILHIGRKMTSWVKEGYQSQTHESSLLHNPDPIPKPKAKLASNLEHALAHGNATQQDSVKRNIEQSVIINTEEANHDLQGKKEPRREKKRYYLGHSRKTFFISLVLMIISTPFVVPQLYNAGFSVNVITPLVAIPFGYLIWERIINIGHDKKTIILMLIPFVNILFLVYCLSMPEGFADSREVDKTSRIIGVAAGFIIFLLIAFSLAVQ